MVAMATSSSLVNDMVLLRKEVSKGWRGGGEEVGGGTWGEKRDAVRPGCDKAENCADTRQKGCHWGGCCEDEDTYEYRRKKSREGRGGRRGGCWGRK